MKHKFSRGTDVKKGPSWQRWEATSSRKSRWPGQATAKHVIGEGTRDQLWWARWAGSTRGVLGVVNRKKLKTEQAFKKPI